MVPIKRVAVSALLILFCSASSEARVRHLLLLQTVERGNLTVDFFTSNLRFEMIRGGADSVKFTEVVVSPVGFDATPEQAIVEFLRSAFADRPKPDLVITINGPAASFGRKYSRQLFPESPLLLAAVDERFLQGTPLAEYETAVPVLNDMPANVDTILELLPQTSTVLVVTGSGTLGTFWRQQLERDFGRFRGRVKFIWSDDLSFAELLQRVASLPANSAIYYTAFTTDALGASYPEDRVLAEIHAKAKAPMFGAQSAMLGHGIVGGALVPIENLGRTTAGVAFRILDGESPANIRVPVQKPGLPLFDWRELQRWGIQEKDLPPGSTVVFREPGVWERFKWVIIAAVSVLVAQALLIGALLINRMKRRRAEQLLQQNVDDLNVARSSLSKLSGKLMSAQEEERTRLARELHDDVGQRMTFVAMDLARLRASLPAGPGDAQQQAGEVHESVIELARDIQALSHQMHSSKLGLLGLSAAADGFCKELSARQKLTIEFIDEDVPTRLPDGVALSVFRVLQETLSNVVKHSGAAYCKVRLSCRADLLGLEVIDDGRGFDPDAVRDGHGIGLISMQERLKLVNGKVAIESRAGGGTAVRVTVPVQPTTA